MLLACGGTGADENTHGTVTSVKSFNTLSKSYVYTYCMFHRYTSEYLRKRSESICYKKTREQMATTAVFLIAKDWEKTRVHH